MAENLSHSPARLYIGFGGSGAKTLAELAAAIVRNGQWGPEVETNLAFLLVDTDRRDIAKQGDRIREACRKIAREPIVRTLHLTQGIPSFQAFAAERLERQPSSSKLSRRLKEKWWFNETDLPFTATKFDGSPEEGAGQCPLISAFVAWDSLPRISEEINSIVEELQRRLSLAKGYQDWTLSTTLVAGLAGGTGRGCWHLLGLKIREELAKIGRHTTPIGFFFDASVFQDVMNTKPEVALKMRVNALTGFSELTAWVRNGIAESPYNYFLPSLDHPDDPAYDCVDTSRVTRRGSSAGHSPVNQALVIFSQGRAGNPGESNRYYEIAANAMYARLVSEIASSSVNVSGFGGVGCASIAVPIEDIRGYVENYKRFYVPSMMIQEDSAADLDRWVAAIAKHFLVPSNFSYKPSPKGDIGEKFLDQIQTHIDAKVALLKGAVDKKNWKRAETLCEQITGWAEGAVDEITGNAVRLLREAFWGTQASPTGTGSGGLLRSLNALEKLEPSEYAEVYGDPDGQPTKMVNPVAHAIKQMLLQHKLYRKNEDEKLEELSLESFRVKSNLATKLATQLTRAADSLKQVARKGTESTGTAKSPKEEFLKARKNWLSLSSGIDADEWSRIENAARAWHRYQGMEAMNKAVGPLLYEAADLINRFAADLTTIVEVLDSQKRDAEKVLKKQHEMFWTAEDFKEILRKPTESVFDRKLLAEHVLEPVIDEDDSALKKQLDDLRLKGENARFTVGWRDLVSHLRLWLVEGETPDTKNQRQAELRRMLHKDVSHLASSLAIPDSFYEQQYGFFQVVRGLLERWGQEFAERAGNAEETSKLHSAFRVLFGDNYETDSKSGAAVQLRNEELNAYTKKILRSMAVELAVRSDVLFEVKKGAAQRRADDIVQLVAPSQSDFDKKFQEETVSEARIKGRFEKTGTLSVIVTHDQKAGGNPFLMLAYAQANFPTNYDDIASLQYYKDTPDLRQWLAACEDPSGASVFMPPDAGLNDSSVFGLGFLSPVFVREEKMRSLRWAPWRSFNDGLASKQRGHILDAIAFALLDESPDDTGDELAKINDSEKWSMPLILFDAASSSDVPQFKFARAPFRLPRLAKGDIGKRTPDHPAVVPGSAYTTVGKLVEDVQRGLGTDSDIAAAIANEAVIYISILEKHAPENKVDPKEALTQMWQHLHNRLDQAKRAATGPLKGAFQQLFDELAGRVEELAKLSPADLKDHFEKQGGG